MDFVFDELANGRKVKTLTVVDDCIKEAVQKAYIESFNSLFRDECLSQHRFASLSHMRSDPGL
jgi:uncharacterized protein YnzC (UPF0291/DUF896 family)